MESEEFMLLPVNQLMDIISSDELNVRSEEQVYKAVLRWVQHNISERRPHLSNVSIFEGEKLVLKLRFNEYVTSTFVHDYAFILKVTRS